MIRGSSFCCCQERIVGLIKRAGHQGVGSDHGPIDIQGIIEISPGCSVVLKGNMASRVVCFNGNGRAVVHYGPGNDLSRVGAGGVILFNLKEPSGRDPVIDLVDQRRQVETEFDGFVSLCSASLHVIISSLEVENGIVLNIRRDGSCDVRIDSYRDFQFFAGSVFEFNFHGQLRITVFFHIEHVDGMVPDTAIFYGISHVFVHGIAKPSVAATGSCITVGEFQSSDFPVVHIHFPVAIDIDRIGILTVIVKVEADGVVKTANGIGMAGIASPLGLNIFSCFRGTRRKNIGRGTEIGTVNVAYPSEGGAVGMVVDPVFQGLKAFRRIGPDGFDAGQAVVHPAVVNVIA